MCLTSRGERRPISLMPTGRGISAGIGFGVAIIGSTGEVGEGPLSAPIYGWNFSFLSVTIYSMYVTVGCLWCIIDVLLMVLGSPGKEGREVATSRVPPSRNTLKSPQSWSWYEDDPSSFSSPPKVPNWKLNTRERRVPWLRNWYLFLFRLDGGLCSVNNVEFMYSMIWLVFRWKSQISG